MKEQKKAEKFVALAEARTNRALNAIRLLGNLSNKANYKYTPEQIEQIFGTLEKQLRDTKSRFFAATTEQEQFKLHVAAETEMETPPSALEDAQ